MHDAAINENKNSFVYILISSIHVCKCKFTNHMFFLIKHVLFPFVPRSLKPTLPFVHIEMANDLDKLPIIKCFYCMKNWIAVSFICFCVKIAVIRGVFKAMIHCIKTYFYYN